VKIYSLSQDEQSSMQTSNSRERIIRISAMWQLTMNGRCNPVKYFNWELSHQRKIVY
jgi:hypothetical protein